MIFFVYLFYDRPIGRAVSTQQETCPVQSYSRKLSPPKRLISPGKPPKDCLIIMKTVEQFETFEIQKYKNTSHNTVSPAIWTNNPSRSYIVGLENSRSLS